MKNPKTSPKPILYSQKVLNKYTFTIIHNSFFFFFFDPIKAAPILYFFFWCVLTCNLSPDWKDSDKIPMTFLISKMLPSCPSFILICVTTSSLCPTLTSVPNIPFPIFLQVYFCELLVFSRLYS